MKVDQDSSHELKPPSLGSSHLEFEPCEWLRLMPFKVRKLLLVASLYDAYLLEEDGRLTDLLMEAYRLRDLGYFPMISRATDGAQALQWLDEEAFDLVVCMMRLGDMDPWSLGRRIKERRPGTPVVLLAYDTPELGHLLETWDRQAVDRLFLWRGDGKILVGVIQLVEDERNAGPDTALIGVPNLLVIEDDLRFVSSYLPVLFEELWDQTNRLLEDDLTGSQRSFRQRGRPRVHLLGTFEEAMEAYCQYQGNLLGIISDICFPRAGKADPKAGIDFARLVRSKQPFLPILLQTSEGGLAEIAASLSAGLLQKDSLTLVDDFRITLQERFGFGDLIFRDDVGREIARIPNINSLASVVESLPGETLYRYFQEGQLTRWLLARTEFALARRMGEENLTGCQDPSELRFRIRQVIQDEQTRSQRGSVVAYSRHFRPEQWHLARIGGGSMGGKARGLAFFDKVLASNFDPDHYPGVSVGIPRTLVLRTDVFDEFLHRNDLLAWALQENSNIRVATRFLQAELSPLLVGDIRDFLRQVRVPLAVRSSSLLEDAMYQPFAGIYLTKMIPNNQADLDTRFLNLANAIKLVMASTFFRQAKSYIEATGQRTEEEKMAVIIQEVVGVSHNARFYPDFAGVARSFNYYPVGNAKPTDGVVNVALGLGKTVVDGGVSLRFTPAFPRVLPQFNSPREMLANSQRQFFAINLRPLYSKAYTEEDQFLLRLPLEAAELDGTLTWLGSTYFREDDRMADGIGGSGPRAVTFAHILRNEAFPLSRLLQELLNLAEESMSCPVEMEFAVSLGPQQALPASFGFLQVRPLVVGDELVQVELGTLERPRALCASDQALGNGVVSDLTDVIYIRPDRFELSMSSQAAEVIGRFNACLKSEGRRFLLVGPGRWGSTDPWLGIPVDWEQISQVKTIVEVSLPNVDVDPSQGSHFFQNMTSLRIGYFTVPWNCPGAFFDWAWLEEQPVMAEEEAVRWIHLTEPLQVMIDGRRGAGLIYKPGREPIV
jgi:CheY-like chemotaxis protein